MNEHKFIAMKLLFPVSVMFMLVSCTAGNEQFTVTSPAGFWYGLWHGIISFISLIIHLFNETVMVYERNNTGGWYDFGFCWASFLCGVAAATFPAKVRHAKNATRNGKRLVRK